MLELLAKFRMYPDLSTTNGWEGLTNWSSSFVDDDNAFKHVSGGSNTIIKKDCLTLGKQYKISFDISFVNTASTFNSCYVGCGTNFSTTVNTNGSKEFYLTCASNTYFSLYASVNTNVYFYNIIVEEMGYTPLDLFPDEDILLNLGIKDVKEYGQNIDTYSRTFSLPGKQTNNNFFKNIFNINEDGIYDFNQFTQATIVIDGQTIKNGVIRLDNVLKLGKLYTYEVTFNGEILGLFADAGEDLLEELDYSDINHTVTDTVIVNSWSSFNVSQENYVYPYINYGNLFNGSQSLVGYRGAVNDTNGAGLLVSDLYPAISYNYLFKKVLSSYGYTYESSVIDSTWFKSLIIPFTNQEEKLSNWWLACQVDYMPGFDWSLTNEYTLSETGNADCLSDYSTGKFKSHSVIGDHIAAAFDGIQSRKTNEQAGVTVSYPVLPGITKDALYNFNVGYQYDTYNGIPQHRTGVIPGTYVTRKKGKYRLEMKFRIDYINYLSQGGLKIFTTRIPLAATTWNVAGGYPLTTCYWVTSEITDWVATYTSTTGGWITISKEIECEKDEQIAFKFVYPNKVSSGTDWLVYNAHVNYFKVYEYGYGNGVAVDFKNVVPDTTKVTDFLSDTLKAFNLFVKVDDNNPKKLLIEDFTTFYASGKTVDLTQKIDLNSEVRIQTPKDYSARQIQLKYKEANDTWNNYYLEKVTDYGYGTKTLEVNDFNEEPVKKIEMNVFKPTILRDYGVNTDRNAMVYSEISSYDYDLQAIEYKNDTNVGPRFLFFKKQDINSSTARFRFQRHNIITNASYAGYTFYPYAGHIQYPFDLANSKDVNFQTLIEYKGKDALLFTGTPGMYSGGTAYMTNNNLYNIFWRDYLNNYIDKTARFVECYVNLTTYDIQNIKLNDTIQIDDTRFYINKIVDFSCNRKDTLTKLELIKIVDNLVDYTPYVTSNTAGYVVNTSTLNNNLSIGGNNIFNSNGNLAIGSGNISTSTGSSVMIGNNIVSNGSIVMGNNVSISEPGNVVIGASDVQLKNGVTGAVVIGNTTSSVKSDRIHLGNAVIINGSVYATGALNDEGFNTLQKDFSNPILNDPGINSIYKRPVSNIIDKWDSNVKNDPSDV